MIVRLLVEVDMFSVFPYYGLEKEKKTIFFDIKCHDSAYTSYSRSRNSPACSLHIY